jgi:outer membrane lipoprotein-sorting protein
MRTLLIKLLWISLAVTCCLSGHATLAVPPGQEKSSQEAQLLQLQNYLNGIRTLRAKFTQTNPDHSITEGTMYLKRLGRESFGKLRLEYLPPSNDRIIADGEVLRHVDGKTKDVSEYSIDSTPASFLLSHKIDFSGDLEVKSMENKGGKIYLTLQRPGDDGVILTLIFVTSPMLRLQEWTLIDAQRNATHVVLKDVQIGVSIDDKLFRF